MTSQLAGVKFPPSLFLGIFRVVVMAAFVFIFCLPPLSTVAHLTGGMNSSIAAPGDSKIITVILVRHAEKETSPADDPPLSEAGRMRAQSLVRLIGKAGIKAIYTTQFLRTQQTVAPLANHLGLNPVSIPVVMDASNPKQISKQYLKAMTDEIYKHGGETILIVGHSNTVPEIIKALGGDSIPSIGDKDFDNLFIVIAYGKGRAKVVSLGYGNQS